MSVSLDGVGEIHNTVRGKNVFKKTMTTIIEIKNQQELYCDSYDIGCTVVKQNIDHLVQLESHSRTYGYPIKYRLGIPNKRIESDTIQDKFSITFNHTTQGAKEFFHYLLHQPLSLYEKFKYYSIFKWLTDGDHKKRRLGCLWKEDGVTLDSRGNLYYCAVKSNNLGSLRQNSGENFFFSNDNLKHRNDIIENQCDECIHDYYGNPRIYDVIYFIIDLAKERYSMKIYDLKLRFMR